MPTLRLIMAQWQGGNNPNNAFGSEMLACLAPKSETAKEVRVLINEQPAFVGLNQPMDYEARYLAQKGFVDIRYETIEKTI